MPPNLDATNPRRVVLVTGASGFIGRHCLAPLVGRGYEVHAVRSGGELGFESPNAIHWHQADLLRPGEARKLVEWVRPHTLIHLAWFAKHGEFWKSEWNLRWVTATFEILQAFRECGGKRFVGAGTCAEYDWEIETPAYDETVSPLRPATLYGAAKASAFLSGQAYADAYGLEFAWGRIFYLFGPQEDPRRIVPLLIRAHLKRETLECGAGDQLRDFLPSASVAEAFVALADSSLRGAVNIGSGNPMTLAAFSEAIAGAALSRGNVLFGVRPPAGPQTLVPRVHRLLQTGWRPPASMSEEIRKCISYWETQI